MKNTNIIFRLAFIQDIIQQIAIWETKRIYCKHDINHFFDVARICYILVLENQLPISKDLIYSTALLHDLGRAKEYQDQTPHNMASLEIAQNALRYTKFSLEEKDMILRAIQHHRVELDENSFEGLFYQADKLSRACFTCPAYQSCYWSEEKKNHWIKY